MARLLTSKGYQDVRPLLGGFDAWVAHGYPVEPHAGPGVQLTTLPVLGSTR